MEIDIQDARALFIEAAAKIADADPDEFVGANRILPKLLAMDSNPELRAAFDTLGREIEARVRAFILAIGEDELADDIASTGFVAAAALAFVTEDDIETV